jgi:hypothetical protein
VDSSSLAVHTDASRDPSDDELPARQAHNEVGSSIMSTSFAKHPRVIKTAVRRPRHGEWIGGNVFGIAARMAAAPG